MSDERHIYLDRMTHAELVAEMRWAKGMVKSRIYPPEYLEEIERRLDKLELPKGDDENDQ